MLSAGVAPFARKPCCSKRGPNTAWQASCGTHRFKLGRLLWTGMPAARQASWAGWAVRGSATGTGNAEHGTREKQMRELEFNNFRTRSYARWSVAGTLRTFPLPSETFRFVPFRSACFRPGPGGSRANLVTTWSRTGRRGESPKAFCPFGLTQRPAGMVQRAGIGQGALRYVTPCFAILLR